ERNILEKFRFTNEKRIYKALEQEELSFLKFPSYREDPNSGQLVLEYIKKSNKFPVRAKDFISSYLELQRIRPINNVWLDIYNQIFRGYFYRTFIISLITLRKKVNFYIALKALILF